MKSKYIKLLWILIFLFSFYFTAVAFVRHDNFHSRRLDLGNMEQTVWNVTRGNGFTLTDPMGTAQQSRTAIHADYLLVLLAPFYILWSDPKLLILIQSIVVCIGALPIFWIAKDKLSSEKLSLLFAVSYLLYPSLQHILLHDFHAVALSTTFLLFAYWYMLKERYVLFLVFALLSGLGKEHVWIAVALMGLFIVFINKKIVIGTAVSSVSAFIFYYLFWHVIPGARGSQEHFALSYLSQFGDTQNSIIINILKNPTIILETFLLPDRLYYYYQLLLPVGFLPIFSPLPLIFSIHSLLINTLSSNGLMRQIDYQYSADIIPFLFISAIWGFACIRSPQKVWLLVCTIAVSTYLWGELPLTRQARVSYFIYPLDEKESIEQFTLLDSKYSVSVTNNIGAHFARRKILYNFPIGSDTADYIFARLGDRFAWPSGDAQLDTVLQLIDNPGYELIVHDRDFYAFKKKSI